MTASRSITSHRESQPPRVWWVNVYAEPEDFDAQHLSESFGSRIWACEMARRARDFDLRPLYRLRITLKEPRG